MSTLMLVEIEWDIHTADEKFAGTNNKLTCEILRDDVKVFTVILEPGKTQRLNRGLVDMLAYTFEKPYLVTPTVPSLSQGVVGVEFPSGFEGHLKMRLRIAGKDQWIKETITVFGRTGELFRDEEGGALLVFNDDNQWVDLGSFTKRQVLSKDSSEGVSTLTLEF